MYKYCSELEKVIEMDIKLINEHFENHAWYNHITDKEQAKIDYVEKYMALAKEMYCVHVCDKSYECEIGQRYIEGYYGKNKR